MDKVCVYSAVYSPKTGIVLNEILRYCMDKNIKMQYTSIGYDIEHFNFKTSQQ